MSNCLLKSPCLLSLQTSGVKYVDNKMPESFQNFSGCLCKTFTKKKKKKTAEDSAETFVYHVSNAFGIPRDFIKGSDLVF